MSENKITYIICHTQGYSANHDLIILAGPAAEIERLTAMADRMSSVNGTRHAARGDEHLWVYGMAQSHPDVFFGLDSWNQDLGGVSPEGRIKMCAAATVAHLDDRHPLDAIDREVRG